MPAKCDTSYQENHLSYIPWKSSTTVTSVYAPTECSWPDIKDDFYNDLNNHLEQIKLHNIHLFVGDFNARVGLDSHSIHSKVIGRHYFYDTTNNNG